MSKIIINCAQCDKELDRYKCQLKNKNNFCDNVCRGKWQSENMTGDNSHFWKGGKIEVKCSQCGKDLERSKNHTERNKKGHFCDHRCYGKWVSENLIGSDSNRWNGGPSKINCDFCGKLFERGVAQSKASENNFCNKKCYNKWMTKKIKVNCLQCGKEFKKVLSQVKEHNFCRPKCSHKWHILPENEKRCYKNLSEKERMERNTRNYKRAKEKNPNLCKDYYIKYSVNIKERVKKYRENPDNKIKIAKLKAKHKTLSVKNLSDGYVKSVICSKNLILKAKDIPQSLVNYKREQIKLLRAVKEQES